MISWSTNTLLSYWIPHYAIPIYLRFQEVYSEVSLGVTLGETVSALTLGFWYLRLFIKLMIHIITYTKIVNKLKPIKVQLLVALILVGVKASM
uniref:Uncharacterized protein n=1 Tax=Acrobeloides nanus TaxID=290746 RepID=A0A914BYY7_9BILA